MRRIPKKRNHADSLSRQSRQDIIERKGQVHQENSDLVQQLRLPSDATDQQIQEAFPQLFQKRTREDTDSDLRIQTTADDRSNSDSDQARAKLLVYRSPTQLIEDLQQRIRDSLLQQSYYVDLINELENTDQNELVLGQKNTK